MQRAVRTYLIVAVALTAAGCLGNLLSGNATVGPDVTGTWSGSARGVQLSVGLGANTCEYGCGGAITGGTYTDSVTGMHGSFVNGLADGYSMSPPGSALYNSPLPGWTLSMTPVDTANESDTILFNGTFASTTAIGGYVKFVRGTASDSVALTLTKQ
jgi:hypothetical protein